MSQQSKKEPRGPLVEAAYALEAEFREVDALMQTALRLPLVSQRNLERTAGALTELSKVEERVAPKLAALLGALDVLRNGQQGTIAQLQERVQEFLARRETFEGLTARYREILADGNRLNGTVQEFAAKHAKPGEGMASADTMTTIIDELGRLVAATEELRAQAKAAEFAELAHETDGLRQQLSSARNRMSQVAEQLASTPAKA